MFQQYMQQVFATIKETDIHSLQQRMQAKDELILIDVREDKEWEKGHIPNAVHISKGLLECKINHHVSDPDKEIILYCGGGVRSAIAASNLQDMGYRTVFSLAGGTNAWCAAGLPMDNKTAWFSF